jgi:NADH dehydrogenase (ubiquinone) Fe-S protein 1
VRAFHASRPVKETLTVTVDGNPVEVNSGTSVLQACEKAGVHIPRFCYHEALSVAGNCRMCLVEVEKVPKCVASCAWPVMPNMGIWTNTPVVKKAREAVMEFLLINHPLDCPICDQGGECDLQDQAQTHGSDRSRYFEHKRGVEDKNVGPLVKTIMTRCIHCTRCVRFSEEIAGVHDFGMTGRGNHCEIGTYIDKLMTSELSGNVIDLCPVGALTSKPYSFTARTWELRTTESVDVHDAIGSNIAVNHRGTDIMRIMPKRNIEVNEEWLNDKSRFAVDGLTRQRLDTPLIRRGSNLERVSWEEALTTLSAKMKSVGGEKMAGIVGDLVDCEALMSFKDLLNTNGCEDVTSQGSAQISGDVRAGYLLNTTIHGTEQADAVLIIGANPRHEATLLNTRLRKLVLHNDTEIATVGPPADLTYGTTHLGHGAGVLKQLATGKNEFNEVLRNAQKPMVIVGLSGLSQADAADVKAAVAELALKIPNLITDEWNGLNLLHCDASAVGALELGLASSPGGDLADKDLVYLLGADEVSRESLKPDAFVVYQGHHGDQGAQMADLILPGAAYTEKHGTYVNMEGRVQMTKKVVGAPGDAQEDWAIHRALSEVMGNTLPYDSLTGVRERMAQVSPSLAQLEELNACPLGELAVSTAAAGGSSSNLGNTPFKRQVTNFYGTNSIARASVTMAKCYEEKWSGVSHNYHGNGVNHE